MYHIIVGYVRERTLPDEFDSVCDAMDFADALVLEHGFTIAYVLDERNKHQYYIEDRNPRTYVEQELREQRSSKWLYEHELERMQSAN